MRLVSQEYKEEMKKDIKEYYRVRESGKLLDIPFVTLSDYLYLLTNASKAINSALKEYPFGTKSVLFFLAAAVSDFSIPSSEMVDVFEIFLART